MESTIYMEMVLVVYFARAAKLTEPFFSNMTTPRCIAGGTETIKFIIYNSQWVLCGNYRQFQAISKSFPVSQLSGIIQMHLNYQVKYVDSNTQSVF